MSDPAKADPSNNSLGSFLTSLALNGGLLVLQVGIFVLLKNRFSRIYTPRTILPPPDRRAEPLSRGPWRWLPQTFITPSEEIISKNGLDAYMSIRFFEMMMKVFGVFTLVTYPILVPLNAVGMPITQQDGLGRLGFGNINPTNQSRYWVHLVASYGLTIFVLWMIRRELLVFVHLRQKFLLSKYHSKLAQAKTVLITSLPSELTNEADLRQLFAFVPGGIKHIWIYKNVPGLPEAYEERLQLCNKLEGAATSLLQTTIKARSQQEAKAEKAGQLAGGQAKSKNPLKRLAFPLRVKANVDDEGFAGDLEKTGPEKVIKSIHRPKHRLGWIPFHGEEVDTIYYCIDRIQELNERIKELRLKLPDEKPFGSCFIQCNLQIGAHVLAQCLSYHEPLFMSDRWIEIAPEDVVWRNIDDGAYEMRTRYVLSWAATLGLIILWGFPVALAGFTSNVDAACASHRWLAWICRTPKVVQGIIQGVFPPVLLAVLFLILPYLLRGLAWFENIPRYSLISLSVYKRYFMFLVVHGFLIITFFSALVEVIRDLQDPEKIVQNFAVYIPNASTFFLTYMLQQGLMGAAGALLQVGPLILFFVKKIFFGNTPREAYEATFMMPSFDFGIMLPRMSLLATIAFAYAIIAPIINGLALITFVLFWISWKFLLIWVLDQPDAQETSGLYFPLLMSNLFTGLYIQHICLMGLFFFAHNATNQHVTIAQGVLMALLIFITACAQVFYKSTFDPVIGFLPMSLSTKRLAEKYEKHRGDGDPVEIAGVDLFSRDRVRSVVRHKLGIRRGASHPLPAGGTTNEGVAKAEREGKDDEAERLKAEENKKKDSEKAEDKADEIMANAEGDKSRLSIQESQKSGKSSQNTKKEGTSKLVGALLSAGPDAIKIDAPAKALVDSDEDEDLEDNAFNHPSTWAEQRFIWLPRWEAFPALSEELVKEIKAGKVDASDIGAEIDDGGNVKVSRGPPDEDWSGGHDK